MKCYSDDPLVVPIDGLHIGAKLQIVEEPVEIMDREVKRLKQSRFPIVKVRWNSRRGPEFIWEREDRFQKKYPHLFTNRASSSNATSLSLEDKAHLTGGDYNTPCFRVIDVVNKSAMYLLVLSIGVDTPFGWIAILVRDRKLTKVLTLSEHNNGHTDESDPYGAEGLRESRKLKHGALSLYMGNGMRAEVEAIRSFDLILPSGLMIVLDNCHYAPTVTRGVVSIPRLVKNGYTRTFTNYGISVSKHNVFYFNAIPCDGIYEIDMHNLYPNVSSMFNVSNKRAKRALDSSYLWHFRLGHINKKRMDKLQRDGILQPTHNESLEKIQEEIVLYLIWGSIHDENLTKTLTTSFWGYALESAARILNMVPTKKVESTPYEIWHGKAPKLSYLRVWCCYQRKHSQKKSSESHGLLKSNRSDEGLKLIQEEDTQPSENTNKEHNEVAPTEVEPQNVRVPIRRSARIPQAPDRYGFYVDVEEHKLGDLNEPPNYKAALSNPKF
ncbi:retrotransposon protein, putative, ty1-copia subclass [Tanacetum coccineum]